MPRGCTRPRMSPSVAQKPPVQQHPSPARHPRHVPPPSIYYELSADDAARLLHHDHEASCSADTTSSYDTEDDRSYSDSVDSVRRRQHREERRHELRHRAEGERHLDAQLQHQVQHQFSPYPIVLPGRVRAVPFGVPANQYADVVYGFLQSAECEGHVAVAGGRSEPTSVFHSRRRLPCATVSEQMCMPHRVSGAAKQTLAQHTDKHYASVVVSNKLSYPQNQKRRRFLPANPRTGPKLSGTTSMEYLPIEGSISQSYLRVGTPTIGMNMLAPDCGWAPHLRQRSASSSRLNEYSRGSGAGVYGSDVGMRRQSPPLAGYHRVLPATPAVLVGQSYLSNPQVNQMGLEYARRQQGAQWTQGNAVLPRRRLPQAPDGSHASTSQYSSQGSLVHMAHSESAQLNQTYDNVSVHSAEVSNGHTQYNNTYQPYQPTHQPTVSTNNTVLDTYSHSARPVPSTAHAQQAVSARANMSSAPSHSVVNTPAVPTLAPTHQQPAPSQYQNNNPVPIPTPVTQPINPQTPLERRGLPCISSEYSLEYEHSLAGTSSTANESQLSSLSPSMDQLTVSSPDENKDQQTKSTNKLTAVVEDEDMGDDLFNLDDFTAFAPVEEEGSKQGRVKAPTEVITVTSTPPCGAGNIQFSLQYFPARKRLRLNIAKADEIGAQLATKQDVHVYCTACLKPGNEQSQQSQPIVFNKNISFNEELFFEDISQSVIDTKSLCLQLFSQETKKEELMGSMSVPLCDVTGLLSKSEVRLKEELKPKMSKKLGKLQFTTQLEKSAKRLTINVVRADDLPKFNGKSPDPLVRITVEQDGKTQTKQTRALKHCCNGVWKEAVMFLVATKDADLKKTNITVSLHDKARTATGFDLIGCCYLGMLAAEKSELDQWKATTNSGREQKGNHSLRFPGATEDDD